MPEKRRRFGKIRKLPSGRYQASFVGPSGERQTAPDTFRLRTEAARWLSLVEADLARGTWVDDKLGRETFGNYASSSGSGTRRRSEERAAGPRSPSRTASCGR